MSSKGTPQRVKKNRNHADEVLLVEADYHGSPAGAIHVSFALLIKVLWGYIDLTAFANGLMTVMQQRGCRFVS